MHTVQQVPEPYTDRHWMLRIQPVRVQMLSDLTAAAALKELLQVIHFYPQDQVNCILQKNNFLYTHHIDTYIYTGSFRPAVFLVNFPSDLYIMRVISE